MEKLRLSTLLRTKVLGSVLFVSATFLILSVVLPQTLWTRLFLILGILSGAVFVMMCVVWMKRVVAVVRATIRAWDRRFQALQNSVGQTRDRLSSLGVTGSFNEEALLQIKRLKSLVGNQGGSDAQIANAEGKSSASLFDKDAIRASKVLNANSSTTVGRAAATIELAGDTPDNLAIVSNAQPNRWARRVSAIATQSLREVLEQYADVSTIEPNRAGEIFRELPHFVVLEESCFFEGAWHGKLESYGTSAFIDLVDAISKAKAKGAVIVVIESDTVSNLTNSLRSHAHVSLPVGHGINVHSDFDTSGLTVVDAIIENYLTQES